MEYKLRVLADNEDPCSFIYHATFGGIKYVDMKAFVEKLTASLEENVHPIILDIMDNNNRYNSYRFYFTRNLAKEWLHKLTPCNKTGGEIKFRAVDWNGEQ